jgi:uncharacterized protein YbjT (DUF2867 family)
MEEKPKLLITGISGYLGAHVTMSALKSSKYQIRGSVRNKDDPKKQKLLSDAFGDKFDNIELVNADLLNEESIRSAVKGN